MSANLDADSVSSSDSEDPESIFAVMKEFKEQMQQIDDVTKNIGAQVKRVYKRAKEETKDWLNEPLIPKPALQEWLKENELPLKPTVEEFLDACFSKAKSMDLESRTLVFRKPDAIALWDGQQRLTVFDIVTKLPSLFE
jgi:hypothetical protein